MRGRERTTKKGRKRAMNAVLEDKSSKSVTKGIEECTNPDNFAHMDMGTENAGQKVDGEFGQSNHKKLFGRELRHPELNDCDVTRTSAQDAEEWNRQIAEYHRSVLKAYAKDEKKYGMGIRFFCFWNDETIPLEFGKGASDSFWTLMRRLGDIIAFEESSTVGVSTRDFFSEILYCE